MSLPPSTSPHGSSVRSTAVNRSVLPPGPVLDAAVSLRAAAACLDRNDVLAAVASLRTLADRLESRLGPPAPDRKRPLAEMDENSQQSDIRSQRPAKAARHAAPSKTGVLLREEHMASLRSQEIGGRDRHALVKQVSLLYSLEPNECAWGNGIITFEAQCMNPRCTGSKRIHRAREPLTLAQRWRLFKAAKVTHYNPALCLQSALR
jgi:hypothetical protein